MPPSYPLSPPQWWAWLLPQHCALCSALSGAHGLCDACQTELPWLDTDRCQRCAVPLPQLGVCGRCLQHPPAFDTTWAAWRYGWPLNRLIPAYKYQARLSLLPVLAQGLLATLATAPRPDCVLAMPLHPSRLRERGFNQSAELARYLAMALQLELALDRAVRIHHAPQQAGQSRKERRRQVSGAFAVTGHLAGLHIAVVDDVMTTGASLNELAHVLKQAGARRVDCWVLARTPD